jgi:branched-chain amino acid transport system permease protein
VTEFLQHLVNGLSIGTIYALVALGYTMVYGVLKLINFAHGDVFMVGSFSGYYVARTTTMKETGSEFLRTAVVTLFAMMICGALGYLVERFAYRPLRHRARLTALITAIGISFLLEYGFQLQFRFSKTAAVLDWPVLGPVVRFLEGIFSKFPPGPTPQFFPDIIQRKNIEWISGLGVDISNLDLIAFGVAVGLMVVLQWIVFRTRFGTAMRAVSFDSQVAGLMGIPVNRVISWTFILGSALAAAAGIIFAMTRHRIDPLLGLLPGLKAFVAAVLGGIGSVPGAMVGGLVLGLAEEFVAGYALSSYRDAIAFAILILVLLLRPEGLFGRVTVEKV